MQANIMTTTPEPPGHDGKCGGKKRDGSGNTCTQPAGWGTDHPGIGRCKLHGGATPNHVAAARLEQARRDVATYGLPVEIEPGLALLQEVHRTAGHVAWLGAKIAEMGPDELVWGITEEIDKGSGEFTGVDTTRAAKPNAWLQLYREERKHLVDVCAAAKRAGVDDAIVKLTEQQGVQLAGVISRVLDALLERAVETLGRQSAGPLLSAWPGWVADVVPGELLRVADSTDTNQGE